MKLPHHRGARDRPKRGHLNQLQHVTNRFYTVEKSGNNFYWQPVPGATNLAGNGSIVTVLAHPTKVTSTAPLLAGAADRNFQRWKELNVQRPFKPDGYCDCHLSRTDRRAQELPASTSCMDGYETGPSYTVNAVQASSFPLGKCLTW